MLSGTMLVSGPSDASTTVGDSVRMAPGMGLLPELIVDQHFAERGRIGRLLGAVAQNPALLGLGIDENTAVIVRRGRFRVVGAGGVYVVDGRGTTYTNITSDASDRTLSVYDVKLHVLGADDVFDLRRRRPRRTSAEAALRLAQAEEGR
jgi:cyanophycinase